MTSKLGAQGVFLALIFAAASAGCTPSFSADSGAVQEQPGPPLTLGCWNLQWFGSPSEGPSDDALQLASVSELIRASDVDVWALVEIADARFFEALLAALPGYRGMVAADSLGEQELGLLYKTSVAGVLSAERILTSYGYEFAGRPPLEVTLEIAVDGAVQELVVIVLHAKAFDDLESWQRRQSASIALKAYLDEAYPAHDLVVLGDYNDDVDASISAGQPSPYANFVADRARYAFPTAALSAAGESSTLHDAEMIDHHLVSNELMARFLDGSAELLDVEDYIGGEASAASDHRPVLSRYER